MVEKLVIPAKSCISSLDELPPCEPEVSVVWIQQIYLVKCLAVANVMIRETTKFI